MGRLWTLGSNSWWLCCGDCSTSGHLSGVCALQLTWSVQLHVHWLSFLVSTHVVQQGVPKVFRLTAPV